MTALLSKAPFCDADTFRSFLIGEDSIIVQQVEEATCDLNWGCIPYTTPRSKKSISTMSGRKTLSLQLPTNGNGSNVQAYRLQRKIEEVEQLQKRLQKSADNQLRGRLQSGFMLTKYDYNSGSRGSRFVRITENGKEIIWSRTRKSANPSSVPIPSILGIFYGCKSATFKRLTSREPGFKMKTPEWHCFSLVTKTRTIDFSCSNEDDVLSWILGVQALMGKNNLYEMWERGELLGRRGWMKIAHAAIVRGVSRQHLLIESLRKVATDLDFETNRKRRSLFAYNSDDDIDETHSLQKDIATKFPMFRDHTGALSPSSILASPAITKHTTNTNVLSPHIISPSSSDSLFDKYPRYAVNFLSTLDLHLREGVSEDELRSAFDHFLSASPAPSERGQRYGSRSDISQYSDSEDEHKRLPPASNTRLSVSYRPRNNGNGSPGAHTQPTNRTKIVQSESPPNRATSNSTSSRFTPDQGDSSVSLTQEIVFETSTPTKLEQDPNTSNTPLAAGFSTKPPTNRQMSRESTYSTSSTSSILEIRETLKESLDDLQQIQTVYLQQVSTAIDAAAASPQPPTKDPLQQSLNALQEVIEHTKNHPLFLKHHSKDTESYQTKLQRHTQFIAQQKRLQELQQTEIKHDVGNVTEKTPPSASSMPSLEAHPDFKDIPQIDERETFTAN